MKAEDYKEIEHVINLLAQAHISMNQISDTRLSEKQIEAKHEIKQKIQMAYTQVKYFPS